MNLNVHLVFPGTCEEAFNLYQQVWNGKISFILRKGEDESMSVAASEKQKISHIVLVKDNMMIAGEDAEPGTKITASDNSKLVLSCDTVAETEKAFDALSAGGKIVMPLQEVHFSKKFGELVDKFGIYWIVMKAEKQH